MKLRNLDEAAALVPDGATVAIGGLSMNSTPMAFVRALLRRGVRDLTLVAIVQGLAVDWLVRNQRSNGQWMYRYDRDADTELSEVVSS